MDHIPVYGKEKTFLEPDTGLLYRSPSFYETAALHTHTFYEVFLVTQGTSLHMINESLQELHPGDFVFIRPADRHTYQFFHSENFHIVNVGFSMEIFESIRAFLDSPREMNRLLLSEFPPTVRIPEDRLKEVQRQLEATEEYMRGDNPKRAILYAKTCLSGLIAVWFFQYGLGEEQEAEKADWFSKMLMEMQRIEFLEEGLPRMLALAGCTENHLCRVFRQRMGMTPTQYINGKRLEYAVFLLRSSDEDMLNVALRCGFGNVSHFYHLFRQKYGTTPLRIKQAEAANQNDKFLAALSR